MRVCGPSIMNQESLRAQDIQQRKEQQVDRDKFAKRLELEDNVSKGVQRLLLYSIIAFLLVLSLNVGIPNSQKLGVKRLVRNELRIDEFLKVQTLEELREFLPKLSRRFKRFSVSSNERFSGDVTRGRELLQQRVEFVRPRTVFTFNPTIANTSFTFAAWVQRLPGSGLGRVAIVRRPMSTERSLNCWGWYEPPEFRYGAHDFHTADPANQNDEEVVGLDLEGLELKADVLSHEVMVVDGLTVSFFRNGRLIGQPQALPRQLTDCLSADAVEVGAPGMALSAVKFFSRALQPAEVDELYQEGAPLADLATGSSLAPVDEDPLLQVADEVADGTGRVLSAVEGAAADSLAETKLLLSPEQHGRTLPDDPIFTWDPSPAAVLPKGAAVEHLLPAWERGGVGGSFEGDYYGLWEAPVHLDGSTAGHLPPLPPDAPGLALSLWFKSHEATRGHAPNVVIERPAGDGVPFFQLRCVVWLDWVEVHIRLADKYFFSWQFLTKFDPDSGKIGEQWLLTAFAQDPAPQVWRNLVFEYDGATGGVSFYLDGALALDTGVHQPQPWTQEDQEVMANLKLWSAAQLLANASVTPHAWSQAGPDGPLEPEFAKVPGKVAQVRAYPRRLSPADVARLQDEAEWPGTVRGDGSGRGVMVRECSAASDDNYFDTNDLDANLHSCTWYADQVDRNPFVCSQAWAKDMCPVTCAGRRLCHDGGLNALREEPAPARTYTVFNRIHHLVPKPGLSSVLCTADQVDREAVVAECRRLAALNAEQMASGEPDLFSTWTNNYTHFLERTFEEISVTDVRSCDELEALLADDQCRWDASWLPEFEADVKETGTWAMTWWVKAAEGSTGMPSNFFFALNFVSRLAPPLLLNHWSESHPKEEPWMDSWIPLKSKSGKRTNRMRAEVWPTNKIRYASDWTMMHVQWEQRADGSRRFCSTMNAMPMLCNAVSEDHDMAFGPGEFLQAIEFSSEMLVSAVEVTSRSLSKAQVQQRYYQRERDMSKRLGPAAARAEEEATEVLPFAQKAVLIAPPIFFQTRHLPEVCDGTMARPVLDAQLQLVQSVHCGREGVCEGVSQGGLLACQGEANTGWHFGRNASELAGERGFSDFLYSIADNNVLVRNGQLLQTEHFIDTLTAKAAIVSIFLSPDSGLTSELVLHVDFTGDALSTRAQYDHLGLVPKEQHWELALVYGALFLATLVMLTVDFLIFKHLHHVASRTAQHIDSHQIHLIVMDLIISLFSIAFSIYTLLWALATEQRTSDVVGDIASIPFVDPAFAFSVKISRFFAAIDSLQEGLWVDSQIGAWAFALMVIMLCRIVGATAIHPQLKVLFGSLQHALNDLWHFGLVLACVYFFFSFTALWLFGDEREDFATFGDCFVAEFEMLMGRLPKDFLESTQLSVFVTLSILVQFFLMRHFIIAILMGGYNKNRVTIETNPVVNGFLTDVVLTTLTWVKFHRYGWPSRLRLVYLLRNKVSSRKVNYVHLRLQLPDIPSDKLLGLLEHYHAMPQIKSTAPAWMSRTSAYTDTSYQYLMKQSLMDVWRVVVPPAPPRTPQQKGGLSSPKRRRSMTMRGRERSEEETSRHGSVGSPLPTAHRTLRLADGADADAKHDTRRLVAITALASANVKRALAALADLSGSGGRGGGAAGAEQQLSTLQGELAGLQQLLRAETQAVCARHALVGDGPELLLDYEAQERARLAEEEVRGGAGGPEAQATRLNLAALARLRPPLSAPSGTHLPQSPADSPLLLTNGRSHTATRALRALPPSASAAALPLPPAAASLRDSLLFTNAASPPAPRAPALIPPSPPSPYTPDAAAPHQSLLAGAPLRSTLDVGPSELDLSGDVGSA